MLSDGNAVNTTAEGVAWWAESKSQAQAVRLIVGALIAVLLGVSAFVWASPEIASTSSVSEVDGSADGSIGR